MYLSTLFLSEIENGAKSTIVKCNEDFIKRWETAQEKSSSAETLVPAACQFDEILAHWDVYREFEEEIRMDLPNIRAMKTICAARERKRA